MVSITISDLHPSRSEQFINELTTEEMKNVEGGARRRRRGSGTIDINDISDLMKTIDNRIDQMGTDLAQTNEDVQKQFGR
jgi:bacteriocin-like protein